MHEGIDLNNSSDFIPAAKPLIGEDEIAEVNRVLRSGGLAQGPETLAFESEFAIKVGANHAAALNSGTSALHMALLCSGVKPGDEVIVPSFTFAATANVVKLVGAEPVFVDIDLDTYCISVDRIKDAITSKTTAIIPVHLYGYAANMPAINELACANNLIVIEDAAQAHLAEIDGKQVGTWGKAAAFSFYPTKNMTSGEGGMVTTYDPEVDRLTRLYRNQGMAIRYQNEVPGYNLRMTDIHAAIGRVQLKKLDEWTDARIANAKFLSENLNGVVTPYVAPNVKHVFHQYTIRVDGDREKFIEELLKNGVGSGAYYPTPVHRLPSFGFEFDLPNTDLAAKSVVSLPIWPTLSESELEKIVTAVNTVANAGS